MGDYGTNTIQSGDVYHFDGPDGGDIEVADGFVTMTEYIETAVYHCWFGGNADDDGSQATVKKQWWGNEGAPKESKMRGRLQALLDGRPVSSSLLPLIEEAATYDITAGMPRGLIESVTVSASAPAPKRIDLDAKITTSDGITYTVNLGVEL